MDIWIFHLSNRMTISKPCCFTFPAPTVFIAHLNINGKNVIHGFDFLPLKYLKRDFFNRISNNILQHERSCLVKYILITATKISKLP